MKPSTSSVVRVYPGRGPHTRPTGLVALVCLLATACEGDPTALETFAKAQPRDPAGFSTSFETTVYGVAKCDVRGGQLAGTRTLRLFNSGGFNMPLFTRALARYYARFGLRFETRFKPISLSMPYALDGSAKRLQRALTKAFPGVDFTAEEPSISPQKLSEIERFVGNFLMRPLIDFAEDFGGRGPDVTNFVLLPKIADGDLFETPDAIVAGLSISPILLQRFAIEAPEDGAVWDDIDLPRGFSPMVFLNGSLLQNKVAPVAPSAVDTVVAHEFGHSAGLTHVEDDIHNLMSPSTGPDNEGCDQNLRADQLAVMATSLNVGPQSQPVGQALSLGPKTSNRPDTDARDKFMASRWRRLRAAVFSPQARPLDLIGRLFHRHVQ